MRRLAALAMAAATGTAGCGAWPGNVPASTRAPAIYAVPVPDVDAGTLPPGSPLPSDAQCAAAVAPAAENKGVNRVYNHTVGGQGLGKRFFPTSDDPRANTDIASRVDGNFTGTTDEILQWAACKWGIDANVVRAQAATESWWRQPTKAGWSTDASFCAPGHPLGKDDPRKHPGQCPTSWGILQSTWYYEKPSWPGIERSTAFNADVAYAIWRACFEGYEWWLRDQPANSGYTAGNQWGCVGRWYAGAWLTSPALHYVAAVKHYEDIKVWTLPYFQQP